MAGCVNVPCPPEGKKSLSDLQRATKLFFFPLRMSTLYEQSDLENC